MKPAVFHADAEAEFKAAVAYYEEQREGLGDELAAEVERVVGLICRSPQAFQPYGNDGYRRLPLHRFSYTIYYLERDDHIWIAAVAHQRRRPGYWADRSEG